jgi:ParB family chromosome partitioning protein
MIDVSADPDKKRRGLGRGLDALLPSTPSAPAPAPAKPETGDRPRTYFAAAIEDVYPSPEQPRRRFADAELDELATSIRAHGVIMALVVRPRPAAQGGYFLIAGERRWRAAQRAGLREVPVVVQDVDAREAFERALVENVQRADLNPIEEATAFQRLASEFGLTQEQIAERVGKDRSTIANAVRLLKLPPQVREHVEEQRLSMGHAKALLALSTDLGADAIETAARAVIAKGLSVRATEELVRRSLASQAPGHDKPAKAAPRKSPAIRDLEERLTRATGGPVTIAEASPGKGGTIEIKYMDLDHLDRLLEKLL